MFISNGAHTPANMLQGKVAYTETMEPQLYCGKCNKSFATKQGFDRHMFSHQGKFKFWCDDCKKGFQNKNNYECHMAKHEGKTFPCQYCTKRFTYEYRLKNHMSEHTNLFKFACALCGQGFNSKTVLDEHQNKHTGLSFKCRQCQKEFFSLSKRDGHEKICKL